MKVKGWKGGGSSFGGTTPSMPPAPSVSPLLPRCTISIVWSLSGIKSRCRKFGPRALSECIASSKQFEMDLQLLQIRT
ncbi:hypothetical protein CEXT_4321 [Caerostris extrusa]|uniref:Uncharacterized protein n=1 Tax=Caerostris extrusa TaxID=172846 RepID=A0AAV4RZQ2_CAEEX|nr:hypothetical protein CEXT_4321 [Caerostris extrusa]